MVSPLLFGKNWRVILLKARRNQRVWNCTAICVDGYIGIPFYLAQNPEGRTMNNGWLLPIRYPGAQHTYQAKHSITFESLIFLSNRYFSKNWWHMWEYILTINVPLVYMAQDDFYGGKSILRAIGGGGPWISRLSWNGHERSECHLGLKKSIFSGPTPSNGPSNGFAPIKIIKSKHHIKRTSTLVILCTRVLLQVYSVFFILYCMLWVLCDFQGPPIPKVLCHRDKVNSLCPAWEGGLSRPLPLHRPLYRKS
jgi:hypothetical protein